MASETTSPQRRQHAKYERLIEAAKTKVPLLTAVAHPCDETSLRGALEAYRAGVIVPLLVGSADHIRKLAKTYGLDLAR
jgi:phosphate acetyltransferase